MYTHEEFDVRARTRRHLHRTARANGNLYEKDGAWWLRTTDFGDDKDRVVIKSDGEAAYIAGDIAYYRDKRDRGFDLCVYMLGADHHGYIKRLKAAAASLGDDPGHRRGAHRADGEPRQATAAGPDEQTCGNVITIDDLVGAVGVDAARYSLIRSSVDVNIDIDLAAVVKQSNDNPGITSSTPTPGCRRWPAMPPNSASNRRTDNLGLL